MRLFSSAEPSAVKRTVRPFLRGFQLRYQGALSDRLELIAAGEPVLVMSDDFLRHYHKRSNVESTFSAIKRQFGDFVRARNDVSMVNEALCKCICHNLCCVILSQIELGIEVVFWKPDDAPRDLLPLARGG